MKVKLFNDGDFVVEDTFKGDKIKIPPGGFLTLDIYEAAELRGQFSPIVLKPDGTPDPKSFRKLRIEKLDVEQDEVPEIFQCHMCRKIYATEELLLKHSALHEDNAVVDHEAEKMVKRKPGRPPKGAHVED